MFQSLKAYLFQSQQTHCEGVSQDSEFEIVPNQTQQEIVPNQTQQEIVPNQTQQEIVSLEVTNLEYDNDECMREVTYYVRVGDLVHTYKYYYEATRFLPYHGYQILSLLKGNKFIIHNHEEAWINEDETIKVKSFQLLKDSFCVTKKDNTVDVFKLNQAEYTQFRKEIIYNYGGDIGDCIHKNLSCGAYYRANEIRESIADFITLVE